MNNANMNYAEVDAVEFGRALRGFGLNLLVRDVARSIAFLQTVLGFRAVRQSADFAILLLDIADADSPMLLQLHGDHTYSNNPLPSLVPENGARGGGMELRLFDLDPDLAEARAVENDYVVLQTATDKPHGLRECFLLDPDGYCWVPSRPLEAQS